MAFFKKFSIDFNKAALWGMHCTPGNQNRMYNLYVNATFLSQIVITKKDRNSFQLMVRTDNSKDPEHKGIFFF